MPYSLGRPIAILTISSYCPKEEEEAKAPEDFHINQLKSWIHLMICIAQLLRREFQPIVVKFVKAFIKKHDPRYSYQELH